MVRLLVGAMARCALGKMSLGEIKDQLIHAAPTRQRLLAPACGLTLLRVLYRKKY
jgi:tRNA U38,U39,U40 pseudouridine synthase TruA